MKKVEYIAKYGVIAYNKRLSKKRAWSKEHLKEVAVYNLTYSKEHQEDEKKHVQRSTIWNKANPKKHREHDKKYRESNKEKITIRTIKWQKENSEKVAAYYMTWRKENPKKAAAKSKRWKDKNVVKIATYNRIYRQSIIGKINDKRSQAKRRGFGFIPLNASFEGSEGHHVTHNCVIYMPKALHRSMYHNMHTGQGMQAINALAIDFLLNGF